MLNRRTGLLFAASATFMVLLGSYYFRVTGEKNIALPESKQGGVHTENAIGEGTQNHGKQDELLDSATPTPEEEALRPMGKREADWRATVFFHRQNARDQNGPVKFYGKVVDQHGEPVVDAEISAYSSYYVESLREQLEFGGGKRARKNIKVSTDKNGNFIVDGYRATDLNLTEICKEGYLAKERLPGGLVFGNNYSTRFESHPLAPMIIPMWKKGNSAALINAKWRQPMVPDGRDYVFEIRSGRVVEDGNLQVSIKADYDAIPDMNNYQWKMKISSPGGAVIESNDAFLYEAPDSGYEASLMWEVKEGQGWSKDLKRSFYVRLKDGTYAGVVVDAMVYHTNNARIVVNAHINPTGSRNLEYDPSKEIEKQK